MRQPPNTPGLYWARRSGFRWWNLILRCSGTAPFMRIDGWDRSQETVLKNLDPADVAEWGPLIPNPPNPE